MSDMAVVQRSYIKSAEENRHVQDMKTLREKNYSEFVKKVEDHDAYMSRVGKEFTEEIDREKMKLEQDLHEIRTKYNEFRKNEEGRFQRELSNLRTTHDQQVSEVKKSQSNEVSKVEQSHKDYIENARKKMIEQRNKTETALG